MEEVVDVRKFCIMGPQQPCGSRANASKIVLALTKSLMIVSPGIDLANGVPMSTSTLLRLYFSCSLFWRCRSAVAVN